MPVNLLTRADTSTPLRLEESYLPIGYPLLSRKLASPVRACLLPPSKMGQFVVTLRRQAVIHGIFLSREARQSDAEFQVVSFSVGNRWRVV